MEEALSEHENVESNALNENSSHPFSSVNIIGLQSAFGTSITKMRKTVTAHKQLIIQEGIIT